MNKAFIVVVNVLAVVFIVLLIFLGVSGAFTKPSPVTEKVTGPYTLVYKEHRGDYAKSGKVQMEIYEQLKKEYGIRAEKGFGIYYDDPAKVKKEDLRSEVGCILEGEDIKKAASLKGGLLVKTLEPKKSVVTDFPFNNPVSILFGIMKAYPALQKYMEDKGIKDVTFGMEIYDVPGKKITYIFR